MDRSRAAPKKPPTGVLPAERPTGGSERAPATSKKGGRAHTATAPRVLPPRCARGGTNTGRTPPARPAWAAGPTKTGHHRALTVPTPPGGPNPASRTFRPTPDLPCAEPGHPPGPTTHTSSER